MSARERLIELLKQKSCMFVACDEECDGCGNAEMYESEIESIGDHLLANGVVVSANSATPTGEWISVKEQLPKNDYDKHWKERKRYLVFTEPCGIMFVATYGYKEHDWWVNGDHFVLEKRNYREVTHWMPLPEPPKGE